MPALDSTAPGDFDPIFSQGVVMVGGHLARDLQLSTVVFGDGKLTA